MQVRSMRRIEAHECNGRTGLVAYVAVDGHTYGLSKLDGEHDWTIDSHFGPGCYPFFANGVGARYTMVRVLTDANAIALLDAACEAIA